jgi:hypothetical protein
VLLLFGSLVLLGGAWCLSGWLLLLLPAEEVRTQWRWRRRQAQALLLFGIVAGCMCTDAILTAVQQEHAVVQLAQV